MIYKLYRRTAASKIQIGYAAAERPTYPTGLVIGDGDVTFISDGRPVEVVMRSGTRCYKIAGHMHMWALKNAAGWRIGKVNRWHPVSEDVIAWVDPLDTVADHV